jgi:hypothetical protein
MLISVTSEIYALSNCRYNAALLCCGERGQSSLLFNGTLTVVAIEAFWKYGS